MKSHNSYLHSAIYLLSNCLTYFIFYLFSAYFQQKREIDVISLDYGALVRNGCYVEAVQNTVVVANCTVQLFEKLLQYRSDIKLSQIHVIGLSLGAQVAGQMAQFLKIGKLTRITG